MKGWECPRCGSCYAPHVEKCECAATGEPTVRTVYSVTYPRCFLCGELMGNSSHICYVWRDSDTTASKSKD